MCRITCLSFRCLEANDSHSTLRIAPGPGARFSHGSGRRRRRRRDSGRPRSTMPHRCSHSTGLARLTASLPQSFLSKVVSSAATSFQAWPLPKIMFFPSLQPIASSHLAGSCSVSQGICGSPLANDGWRHERRAVEERSRAAACCWRLDARLPSTKRMEMMQVDVGLASFGIAAMSQHGAYFVWLKSRQLASTTPWTSLALPLR